ncbi:hypothetical protein Mycch_4842 [Mycolicibacterium chubuense NBB4]|uniref:Mycothiol-dependent maleylpyruvate isomerase metal-binding domain-containing protein n=1 Tax=Mycolicibacterium chubuense (strain NBB4) TaxID=710421 RepID=I4BQI0_MYCCN|nr:maleylpyruvate isomerase family mycothiol-dependent enzyme [Mycolicibacterium chubuense]AFM19537.1 hypothetical protein Mycch_4842 [Mycolicibacterium chubuense NBB4]
MSTVMELACAERADLAELLATLSPQQWASPSLCTGWTVKDVVAHVISYEELGVGGLLGRFAKGRVVNANQVGVEEYSSLTTQQLVDVLRAHLRPRGLTAAFGGMIGLVDTTIHHQDIRRALSLPRAVPAERLLRVLSLVQRNPRLGTPRRIRGLRLQANDIDWQCGHGLEVLGPGEALLMAITGRGDALGDLSGPGQPVLAARVGP